MSGPVNGPANGLSHLDDRGRARMVDVAAKPETERAARAEASVTMAPETLAVVPAVAYALAIAAGLPPAERQAAVVLAAVPTAPSATALGSSPPIQA